MSKRQAMILAAALVLVLLVAGRIYLPFYLEQRINDKMAGGSEYRGSVQEVDVHLYIGEYRIKGIIIDKPGDDILVPFLEIPEIRLSVEWGALLHGALVGEVEMWSPRLNFAVSEEEKQTGEGQDWTQPVKDLMPIQINRFTVTDGEVTFQDFSTDPPLSFALQNFQLQVLNIRNLETQTGILPSGINLTADKSEGGDLSLTGSANLLKPIPDFDLAMELENVSLPTLNDFAEAYLGLDFEAGVFNLYSELAVADGVLEGYLKPVITDLQVLSLEDDSSDPLGLLWEATVAFFTSIFENQPQDQFAANLPLEGNLNNMEVRYLAALGSILRNAFVEALALATDNSISLQNVLRASAGDSEEEGGELSEQDHEAIPETNPGPFE